VRDRRRIFIDDEGEAVGTQREIARGMQPSMNKPFGNSDSLASRVDDALSRGKDVASTAKDVASDVKDAAFDAADSARGKLGAARERLGDIASSVGDSAMGMSRGARDGVVKASKSIANFVEDRPWVAVGAAFVLGAALVSLVAIRRR
jgi:ElaB/YqjD/DUF883 family membrane-anchored ribosome-binding protein